jgi:RNase H-fold protein (predicted Holliday junction resolvase)
VAVGKKTETANKMTMAQTEKITVEARKRTVNTWETAEETRKTVAVNKKMEGESLYQNHRNTRQTDGMTILYILKKKKLNQEQGQELVH